MNCKIETTPDFARELKQLAKVRFPIASKAKGKSGGARVITHTVQTIIGTAKRFGDYFGNS